MAAVNTEYSEKNRKIALDTLFSLLDKGIDDLEAGRLHTVDEAFQIINERLGNDIQGLND